MEDIPEAVKRAFPYITVKVWNLLSKYHKRSIERLAEMDAEKEEESWFEWRKKLERDFADVEEVEEALKGGIDNAVPLELVKKRLEDRDDEEGEEDD